MKIILLLIVCPFILEIMARNSERENSSANLNPVIGILTLYSTWDKLFKRTEYSYIPASYVKYIESVGARVIPIKYDLDSDSMREVLSKINGVLLPGGGSALFNITLFRKENITMFTKVMDAAKVIIDYAIEENDKGNHYPVYGTCLGFEMMLLAASNKIDSLTIVNNTNRSLPIHFYDTSYKSRFFGNMPEEMKLYISKEPVFFFNHKFAITPDSLFENKELNEFYKPIAVNTDSCGKSFVSMIEGVKYPFFGTQFHTEKGSYEWKSGFDINHSMGAIEADRYFAYFFVEEARKNKNEFPKSSYWQRKLIYNYYPIQYSISWNLVYVFSKPSSKEKFQSKYMVTNNGDDEEFREEFDFDDHVPDENETQLFKSISNEKKLLRSRN